MVIGTFLIAFNLSSVNNQDKTYTKRRDACADFISTKINKEQMIKIMGIKTEPSNFDRRLIGWCGIYGLRALKF